MKKAKLAGQKIGRLLVVKESGRNNQECVIWECRCECGKTVFVHLLCHLQ